MKKIFRLTSLLFLLNNAACSFKSDKPFDKNTEGDSIFFSTETESSDRVKASGLYKTSEYASYLLDTSKLRLKNIKSAINGEYQADPELEWVINVNTVSGMGFTNKNVERIFDAKWRTDFPSTIYGFSQREGKWTYALAGDSPELFSKLQIGIDLLETYKADNGVFDRQKLLKYIAELTIRAEQYGEKLNIAPSVKIDFALQKSRSLVALFNQFNSEALLILQSEGNYDGEKVWDVLQSAGLKWGDGDLFHWNNNSDIGGDVFFSVATSTEPGYFLPESVKAGQMNPKNLLFGFTIPRNPDPEKVFEQMYKVVEYAQKRLGGHILGADGNALNYNQEQLKISEIVKAMNKAKIVPGSNNALRMF